MIKHLLHKHHVLFAFTSLTYVFIYLSSIGDLVFSTAYTTWNLTILSNWSSMVFNQRSLLLFEPIIRITFPFQMAWLFSPMNFLIAIILGILVGLNIVAFWVALRLPKQCRIKPMYSGFFGMIMGFLSGITCCLPTFLLPLVTLIGVSASQLIAIRPWIIPISVSLLLFGLITTVRRIDQQNLKKF